MARSFAKASSQYLQKLTAAVTAVPLTFAGWFNPTTSNTTQEQICVGDANATTGIFALFTDTTGHLGAQTFDGATSAVSLSSGTVTNGSWAHVGGVFSAVNNRQSFLNGVASTADTTSVTPSGITETLIGARTSAAPANFADGLLAEFAVWNAALNADEMTALSVGMSPLRIRPDNIVGYWPLWGIDSPEPDWTPVANANLGMTLTNGPTQGNHAPIIYTDYLNALWYVYANFPPPILASITATQGSAASFTRALTLLRNITATQGSSATLLSSALLRAVERTSVVGLDGNTSTQVI